MANDQRNPAARYAPFDAEVILTLTSWNNIWEGMGSAGIIRRWNMRLGLMQKYAEDTVGPTRIPWRAVEGNPNVVSVDDTFYRMLLFDKKMLVSSIQSA